MLLKLLSFYIFPYLTINIKQIVKHLIKLPLRKLFHLGN